MIFCVFIFIFCLELAVREQLNGNDFRHYYYVFFESTFLKLLDHSYVQNSFATIKRHFDKGIWNDALQLKILRTWISIWTNCFLSIFLETKINESTWKIMYIIICACSSKNIAPRHFIYYCMLLLLSNKPSFWIWHCVAPIIFATTYLSFFYFLYSVFLEVNPEPPCFL